MSLFSGTDGSNLSSLHTQRASQLNSSLSSETPPTDQKEYTVARCDTFTKHFPDKTTYNHALEEVIMPDDVPLAFSCPVLWDSFQLLQPEDMNRLLWSVRPSACVLDPCPAGFIRSA